MELYSYDKSLISTLRKKLAIMFDYAVYMEHENLDKFFIEFVLSNVSSEIELGNINIIEGISGVELYYKVKKKDIPDYAFDYDTFIPSREYYLGYYLAYAQWYLNISYKEIANAFKIDTLLSTYEIYHEIDVLSFCDYIYKGVLKSRTNLKRYRTYYMLSLDTLSALTSIDINNLKNYEDNISDISKAPYNVLFNISRYLSVPLPTLVNNIDIKINLYEYNSIVLNNIESTFINKKMLYEYIDNFPISKIIKYNNNYYIKKSDFINYTNIFINSINNHIDINKLYTKVLININYDKWNNDIVILDYIKLINMIYE